MNTFDHSTDCPEEKVEPEAQPLPEKERPSPSREEDTIPVFLRPANRRAGAFLPEWLRRMSHG